MNQIPVALQLYGVRREYAFSPDACLKAIADMGYQGVEFYGDMDRPAQALKASLDAAGLAITGWHTPIEWLLPERLSGTIAYMKLVGNTRLICPWLGEAHRSRDGLMSAAERFSDVCARLAGEGMRAGYHSHDFDFDDYGGISGWELIAEHTPDDFILQLDTGNCEAGGADSLAMLKKYIGRGETIHVKPYSRATGYATMIGEDTIDWAATLGEIRARGACEWLIVEYECEKLYTQFEGSRKCLEVIRKLNG